MIFLTLLNKEDEGGIYAAAAKGLSDSGALSLKRIPPPFLLAQPSFFFTKPFLLFVHDFEHSVTLFVGKIVKTGITVLMNH